MNRPSSSEGNVKITNCKCVMLALSTIKGNLDCSGNGRSFEINNLLVSGHAQRTAQARAIGYWRTRQDR